MDPWTNGTIRADVIVHIHARVCFHCIPYYKNRNEKGVFVKHYAPAATKSEKEFCGTSNIVARDVKQPISLTHSPSRKLKFGLLYTLNCKLGKVFHNYVEFCTPKCSDGS